MGEINHAIVVEYAAIAKLNGRQVGENDLVVSCICGWKSKKIFRFGNDRAIRREYARHYSD